MVRNLVHRNKILGVISALATVATWTTWTIASRYAMRGGEAMDPILLTFIRYGTAAIVLAPFWIKFKLIPKQSSFLSLGGLLCAGLPYQFLVLAGLHYAPATIAGPLLTGSLPLFVSILAITLLREKMSPSGIIGVIIITSGVLVILGNSIVNLRGEELRGGILLLMGSLTWAIYTISFRRSGLSGFQATAFVAIWSVVLLIPFYGAHIVSTIQQVSLHQLVLQIFIQGLMAGVAALMTYTIAIKLLGPTFTTVITSLTPVMVNAVSILVLGEVAKISTIIGCIFIVSGVLVNSGIFNYLRREERKNKIKIIA